jgi:type I restriction enzyme M protein
MSDNNTSAITQKVWSMCGVLYDDGVSYGDYLEQLTYLIFLKMADEYSRPPYKRSLGIPEKYIWKKLYPLSGAELETHYKKTLFLRLGDCTEYLSPVFDEPVPA